MPQLNRTHSFKKEAFEIISKLRYAAKRRSRLLEKCQRCITWGHYLTVAGGAVVVLAIVSPLSTLWHAIAGLMLVGTGRVLTDFGKSKGCTVKEQMEEDNNRLEKLTRKGREMSSRLCEAAEIVNQLNRDQKKKTITTWASVVGGVLPSIRARWPQQLAGLATALMIQSQASGTVRHYESSEDMNHFEYDIAGLQKDWDAFVEAVVWESQNLSGIPEMYTSELRGYCQDFFQELKALLRRMGYLLMEETSSMEDPFSQNISTISLNAAHGLELVASLIQGNLWEASQGLRDLAESADSIVNELNNARDLFDMCLRKYSCT
ncbi:uncharacterized protein LOC112567361 [Pomacea canaliculata]|uniref:uncharacterized protein LOC112567361 n=1 Tax=Pomacea canaliculata TaxID=400727 RepID=UPI000D7277F1|nr:uncharacterized protein LOC112567361 [Pomacea canaliculata]